MSRRHFSDWIDTYLSLMRQRTEAPELFHLWSSIATIGAAVTRRVCIDEVIYRIYPNWIIVLAAIPGRAKKSTTVDSCTALLRYNHSELFGADETNWPDICRTFAEKRQFREISRMGYRLSYCIRIQRRGELPNMESVQEYTIERIRNDTYKITRR